MAGPVRPARTTGRRQPRLRLFVVAGACAFAILLIAMAPARLVHLLLPSGLVVELADVGGTIWNGHGVVRVAGRDEVLTRLHWDVVVWRLLLLDAVVGIEADGGIEGSGQVALDVRTRDATADVATLRVSASLVNRFGARYFIEIAEDITANGIRLAHDRRTFTDATGIVDWRGGHVRYVLNGEAQRVRMPPLTAGIGLEAGGLQARVESADGRVPMLFLTLAADGWATVRVTRAFIESAGQTWLGNEGKADVVIEVQEQIAPT